MDAAHVQLGYLIVIQTFGIIGALVYLHHAVRAEGRLIRETLDRLQRPDRGDPSHD